MQQATGVIKRAYVRKAAHSDTHIVETQQMEVDGATSCTLPTNEMLQADLSR